MHDKMHKLALFAKTTNENERFFTQNEFFRKKSCKIDNSRVDYY